MKLIRIIPKHFFRSRKSRSLSRSDPFGSATSSSSSDLSESSSSNHGAKKSDGSHTPTSVLPADRSGQWTEITADTCYELLQALKLIDKEADAKLTADELAALLGRVGDAPPTAEELATVLQEVDGNGGGGSSGCISMEEFAAISSAIGPPACDSELRDAFEFFDADHDGKISAEELHRVFASIGVERCTLADCRRMIRGVDKNGDGFVCFEDFSRMMVQHR